MGVVGLLVIIIEEGTQDGPGVARVEVGAAVEGFGVGASDGGKVIGASVGAFDGTEVFDGAEGIEVTWVSVGEFDEAVDG